MNRLEALKILWNPKSLAPRIEVTLEFDHYDKNGKHFKHTKQRCHSYVQHVINILSSQMSQVAGNGHTMVDTGGVSRAVNPDSVAFSILGTLASNAFGIQVGTGTTAVAITQTALVTLIAEGTGAGQLNYAATTRSAPITDGATRRFTIIRSLTNNSAGNITIQEVGLAGRAGTAASGGPWNFLLERSLSVQTINTGGAVATATYTIGVTV